MKIIIISFVTVLLITFIMDGIWLKSMGKSFYFKKLNNIPHMSDVLAEKPNLIPAIIFYIIFALGLVYLVVTPALSGNYSLTKIFLNGAVLGLVAYSTYDLTNQAIFEEWPTIITVVDIIWGSFLTGTVSTIAVAITKYFA